MVSAKTTSEGKDTLSQIKERFKDEMMAWCERKGISFDDLDDEVVVTRPLSSYEAIGEPDRDDFPLLRGEEVLMHAVYRGSAGQAFTSAKGAFSGTLKEVLGFPLSTTFERATFVCTMNAVMRYLGLVEGTVHCKDSGPKDCASRLKEWLRDEKITSVGLVGMQPAFLEALVEVFGSDVMVSDMQEAGNIKYGREVLDGMDQSELFEQSQLVFITSTTLVNNTIDDMLKLAERNQNRVVFYGTTIAGAAYLMGWDRWCVCSS